ncbi:MAG: SBBP repeat-containing protein [Nitrospirae bacterium]|nr:SBBP repeat-containing protein [Nitrospirota bacterium]
MGTTYGILPGQTPAGDPSTGDADTFLRKYDSEGNKLWTRQFGTSGWDGAFDVGVDADGNVYIAGYTNPCQTCGGDWDAFLCKYDSEGNELWTRQFGTPNIDYANSVAVGRDGNVYVGGGTNGDIAGSSWEGGSNAYVRKYDPFGNVLWTHQFGSSGDDDASSIAVDRAGNVYIVGSTNDNLPGQDWVGDYDAYVKKYDSDGTELWTYQFGTPSYDDASGVTLDNMGNLYVVGTTYEALPWQTWADDADAYVLKMSAFNTPTGTDVGVTADLATVIFPVVSVPGDTILNNGVTSGYPPVPSGFVVLNDFPAGPAYFDITTTASFSGQATVCIPYPSNYNEPQMRLLHYENDSWVDVTSLNDPNQGIICGQVSSFSPFVIVKKAVIIVTIDIKPGSNPNSINLGSGGTVPVAILSTTTFDATTVDPMTVTLASAPVKLKGKGTPMASLADVNEDGLLDLIVHVTTEALQLTQTDTTAILEGKTFNGNSIRGSDTIRVIQ